MNTIKNWAIALLGVLALSVNNGCQPDGYDTRDSDGFTPAELDGFQAAQDEHGEIKQPINIQYSTGAPNGFALGMYVNVTPPGSACLYPNTGAAGQQCALPVWTQTVRVNPFGNTTLGSALDPVVAELSPLLTGGIRPWNVSKCDGCGAFEVALIQNLTSGDAAKNAFDARRYITRSTTVGAALTESPSAGGTWHVATGFTCQLHIVRLNSDCDAVLGYTSAQRVTCKTQGAKHLVAQCVLGAIGVGADAGNPAVSLTRDNYSSYDMAPNLTAKTMLSTGQRCRVRDYAATAGSTVIGFGNSDACANN